MPIYEYRCRDCARLSSIFVRNADGSGEPACQHCGSHAMARAVSRFSVGRTEQQVMEQFGMPDPGAGPDAYKDPRQIGRWVEKRFDDMGMELPQEARQMIDAARQGEFPDPVKDL